MREFKVGDQIEQDLFWASAPVARLLSFAAHSIERDLF